MNWAATPFIGSICLCRPRLEQVHFRPFFADVWRRNSVFQERTERFPGAWVDEWHDADRLRLYLRWWGQDLHPL